MRKKPTNFLIKYFKLLKAAIIILMLVFSLQFVPAMAQSNQASVAIDGKQLFRVSDTNNETAEKRADYINRILKDAVESQKAPEIEVKEFDEYAKLFVDGKPITVTSNDVLSAENVNQQAYVWEKAIRERVNQAIEERSENFIPSTLILSSVLIVLTVALHFVLGKLWKILQRNVSPLVTSEDSSDQNQQQNSLNLLLKATIY